MLFDDHQSQLTATPDFREGFRAAVEDFYVWQVACTPIRFAGRSDDYRHGYERAMGRINEARTKREHHLIQEEAQA